MNAHLVGERKVDYQPIIERVFDHVENDQIDKAVTGCLRISRNLGDFLNAAIFLREFYPNREDFARTLYDDTSNLKADAQNFLYQKSFDIWIKERTLDYEPSKRQDGEKANVLVVSIGEIDSDIEQCERWIKDATPPTNMGQFDTAAFFDEQKKQSIDFRVRIKALQTIKQRVRLRCLDYAISVQRRLEAQSKATTFLDRVQNQVNNYFKTHSEDTYTKLQKAANLIDSHDVEDHALLLTEVRRALKGAADYFYPPKPEAVKCVDGKERILNDEKFLDRLHEYIMIKVEASSSRDILIAEYNLLALFMRRLNVIASKGVHATVTAEEATQGFLGLYLFLYNVTFRLQTP